MQYDDRLNVCSMRKHVHRLKRNHTVAVSANRVQFAGERLRITRDVDGPSRLETTEDLAQDGRRTPFAWWIENDGLGAAD